MVCARTTVSGLLIAREGRARSGVAITLAAIVVAGVVAKLVVLLASPYPLGIDGYAYAVNLRALAEEHRLIYPSLPGVYTWLAPFAAVFGSIVGVKIGAAVGLSLAAVPAYLLVRRAGGAVGAALVGAVVVATSVEARFLSTEFVKQGLGLTLALSTVVAVRAAWERRSVRNVVVAVAFAAAAALTHKTAPAIALVLLAPELGVPLVAAITWLAAPELVHGLFGAFDPRFSVFRALTLGHEVALAAGLALVVLVMARGRVPRVWWGVVVLALVLALPWLDVTDGQGLAFRLRLTAWLALGPLVAIVIDRLDVRRGALAAVALVVVARGFVAPRDGVVDVHPYLVASMDALRAHVPPGTEVACPERQIVFAATWATRADVRLRPAAPQFRLLPGAWMTWVSPELKPALARLVADPPPGFTPPPRIHPTHADAMVLLNERSFVILAAALSPEAAQRLAAWPVR